MRESGWPARALVVCFVCFGKTNKVINKGHTPSPRKRLGENENAAFFLHSTYAIWGYGWEKRIFFWVYIFINSICCYLPIIPP